MFPPLHKRENKVGRGGGEGGKREEGEESEDEWENRS